MSMRGCIFIVLATSLALNAAAALPRLDLIEPDRHARADAPLTRTLSLTNPTSSPLKLAIEWKTLIPPAVIETGRFELIAGPGQTARHSVRLKVPPVKRPVAMNWLIQGGPDRKLKTVTFILYPAPNPAMSWGFIKGRTIGIRDSDMRLTDFLTSRGATVVPISNPAEAAEQNCELTILRDAIDSESWREFMAAWQSPQSATKKTPLLIFLSSSTAATTLTSARIVAPGHPFLAEITPGDLSNWRSNGVIASSALPIPAASEMRRLIAPADPASTGTLLGEFASQSGAAPRQSGYLCSFNLIEKIDEEPACELLLNKWLRAAIGAQPVMPRPIRLLVLRDDSTPDDEPTRAFTSEDENFVKAGGDLAILNMSPENISDRLRRIVLGDADLTPANSAEQITFPAKNNPLLWGADESDWRAASAFRSPYRLPSFDSPNFKMLVEPGIAAVRKHGKGRIFVIQLHAKHANELLVVNQFLANLMRGGHSVQP